MASIRQKQVGELVKRHFSRLLLEEGQLIYDSRAIVTVTNVEMSPDLNQATIYISVFNVENKDEVIQLMDKNYGILRSGLGNRLKRHVRKIPMLDFRLDETLDEMERMDQLFKKLRSESQLGVSEDE